MPQFELDHFQYLKKVSLLIASVNLFMYDSTFWSKGCAPVNILERKQNLPLEQVNNCFFFVWGG